MHQTVVLNISGLTSRWLASAPFLSVWMRRGKMATIRGVLPCVENTMQATYVTGKAASGHGIVGNGWYFRNECVVRMRPSANALIQSPKLWEIAQRENPDFTCASLFWKLTRYANCHYWASCDAGFQTHPITLSDSLKRELGPYRQDMHWTAKAILWIMKRYHPTLILGNFEDFGRVLERYPHNDPRIHHTLMSLDRMLMDLIEELESQGSRVVLLSDHGVTEIQQAISINRFFREKGLLGIRTEGRQEILDTGLSKAFAVCDHQVAHVYLNDPSLRWKIWHLLEKIEGIEHLLDEPDKVQHQLYHPRSGDIIAVSARDRWFSPEFGDQTVDLGLLPGFFPTRNRLPWQQPLYGSYGAIPENSLDWPLFMTQTDVLMDTSIDATDVLGLILQHLRVPGLTTCS